MSFAELRRLLNTSFSESDLSNLCFDLNINYEEDLRGEIKSEKIISLLHYCQQRGLLPALLAILSDPTKDYYRPHITWPPLHALTGETAHALDSDEAPVSFFDQLKQNRALQIGVVGLVVLLLLLGGYFIWGQEPDSTPLPTPVNNATDTAVATETPIDSGRP